MRRFVATIVLALVTVIHGAETMLCADGCTDESRQEASTSTPEQDDASACLLCQSSIVAGPDIPRPCRPITRVRLMVFLDFARDRPLTSTTLHGSPRP